MKYVFDEFKNLLLKETRGVCFEDIVNSVENKQIIENIAHHNQKKYPHQRILIIKINNYIYAVPYVLDITNQTIFLKTIYPSRDLTKKYLERK